MRSKVSGRREPLTAPLACIGSLTCVTADVRLEKALSDVPLPADVAPVRCLIGCVNVAMIRERGTPSERLAALLAPIRHLTCMSTVVCTENVRCTEPQATPCTPIGSHSCVDAHVSREVDPLSEACITHTASVRSLTGMRAHMPREITRRLEVLTALRACSHYTYDPDMNPDGKRSLFIRDSVANGVSIGDPDLSATCG